MLDSDSEIFVQNRILLSPQWCLLESSLLPIIFWVSILLCSPGWPQTHCFVLLPPSLECFDSRCIRQGARACFCKSMCACPLFILWSVSSTKDNGLIGTADEGDKLWRHSQFLGNTQGWLLTPGPAVSASWSLELQAWVSIPHLTGRKVPL